MGFWSRLAFSVALALAIVGTSQLPSLASAQNVVVDSERQVYDFVRRTCASPREAFGELYSEATMANFDAAGRVWFLDFEGMNGLFKRRGYHSHIQMVLESNSLHTALKDCFGDDLELKQFYVLHLIAANGGALYAGVIGGIGGPIKLLKWSFGFVQKYGWNPLMQFLISKEIISAAAAQRLGYLAGGTVIAGLSALPIIEVIEGYSAKKQALRADVETDLKDFKEFYSELATLTASANDQNYKKAVIVELRAIGRKIKANPTATEQEVEFIRVQLARLH